MKNYTIFEYRFMIGILKIIMINKNKVANHVHLKQEQKYPYFTKIVKNHCL